MNLTRILRVMFASAALLNIVSCSTSDQPEAQSRDRKTAAKEKMQVPGWSRADMDFFLHGSMSTEVFPEAVLRGFIRTYPDLFAGHDFSQFGLIPDPAFGWPIGFSRANVPHLGGLSSVGVNCSACHVGEVIPGSGGEPVRVLGMSSHFDAEAYFGAVIAATFKTAEPGNMKRFLAAYLVAIDPACGEQAQTLFASEWQRQEQKIAAAISNDPSGSKGLAPGALHKLTTNEVRLNRQFLTRNPDLPALAHSMLKLFHNMRAALHVPDQPPEKLPPASGPGRNDAFGLLSAVLFNDPQPFAPVKYGLVWNLDKRRWVHWDGNTQSPIGRNLLASLGLGAPLIGKHGQLDFALVKRQTDLSEKIRAPKYPFAIDHEAARRGAAHYKALCASCHDTREGDGRLYPTGEIGTEPHRAELFTALAAARFNKFLRELETPGYSPSGEPGIRSTRKYWAASLHGVWGRSPYLHNGSVRTMRELLSSPDSRAKSFRRGSRVYDAEEMGYTDEGRYVLDTATAGNSNAGHNYGTALSSSEKRELMEFLKTL